MPDGLPLLIIVIVAALAFDFINGFHDTANAIATSVSTRVLSPRVAILMASVLNFLGAWVIGTAVAETIGTGIVRPESVTQTTVLAALLGAIFWNLLTWYLGLPSSSSHALIGGLAGAAVESGGLGVLNLAGLARIFTSLLTSPVAGVLAGLFLMVALMWVFRRESLSAVNGYFRYLQVVSAAFMAFSHGSNDAQKTMGIITLALVTFGFLGTFHVPWWVVFISAAAMGLGTAVGGWNIIKTVGVRLVKLQPVNGFAAETSAALIIQLATHVGLPVSTTHVIASSIMGVGASKRFSAVRWGVAGNIAMAWILTLPVAAALGWLFRFALGLFGA